MRASNCAAPRPAVVWAIAAMLAAGCSNGAPKPKTVRVTGKVLYKSQPVAGASVAFLGSGPNTPSAMGKTDAQGVFELTTIDPGDGAVPGTYQVTVTKMVPSKSGAGASKGPMSMEDAAKRATPTGPAKEADASEGSLLPERYARASTSNLSFVVKEGEKNDFPIELND